MRPDTTGLKITGVLLVEIYKKIFLTYKVNSVKRIMKEWERGIVFGNKGPKRVGHVFNVIKENGMVKFVDGQSGTAANLHNGYISFKYLKTK
jgi:Papain fold toxin 1, glutamine deamidase